MISIGSLSLDDSYSPVVNTSYEYYKSTGGEIIGGFQLIKITGSVLVPDNGSATGGIVMSKLKQIIDLGKKTQCIPVNITGFYSGLAKVNGVTADQGSDPTWINKGDFSIEIKAPLNSLPENSFDIVAKDCVTELSRYSKIELPEDSHGYIYYGSGGLLSKTFAIKTISLTVKCEPLCGSNSFFSVVNKLIKDDLHSTLAAYDGWSQYARSLSVQTGPDNTATITKEYIITPHSTAMAFVDLSFNYDRSYDGKSKKKVTTGTITGLTDASSFDSTTIVDTCSSSRMANAEAVFSNIQNNYNKLSQWSGLPFELTELSNCPNPNVGQGAGCYDSDADNQTNLCLKPRSSTVSRSRTEGTINFSFEWNSDGADECDSENGITTDVSIETKEPEPQYVEFVIPSKGTLIQNLNTVNARTVKITVTQTFPESSCGAISTCTTNTDDIIENMGLGGYLLILDKKTVSTKSITTEKQYIQCN